MCKLNHGGWVLRKKDEGAFVRKIELIKCRVEIVVLRIVYRFVLENVLFRLKIRIDRFVNRHGRVVSNCFAKS